MNGAHLGDEAELFALGVLDDDEAREVERHIAGCATCAGRVASAQLVAGSLAAALPTVTPNGALAERISASARVLQLPGERSSVPISVRAAWPRAVLWLASVAAAAGIAVAVLGGQLLQMRERVRATDLALVAVSGSHFEHVTMSPVRGAAVIAKVIYANDGSWTYVVVQNPAPDLSIIGETSQGEREVGKLIRLENTGTLFVRSAVPFERITLRSGAVDVASATLHYPDAVRH